MSRVDSAELLAGYGEQGIGVGAVDDVVGDANDVGERESALPQRRFDGVEAVSRLIADIRRQNHAGVVISGGAGHEREITVDDGAAEAGGLFERRAG